MVSVKRMCAVVTVVLLIEWGWMPGIVQAQNGFCKSSYNFRVADQSTVVINPTAPATLNELYNTNSFTWEAWFRLNGPVVNQSVIISTEDGVAFQDILLGFGFGPTPGALCFSVSDNGTTNSVRVAESTAPLALNTWYHLAAVCDYNAPAAMIYLNGTQVGFNSLSAQIISNRLNQSRSTFIGNASVRASAGNLSVDEVRFWNRALTPVEIAAQMSSCLTLPQTGLVAWFDANEPGGNNAVSRVNNRFIGQLISATRTDPAPISSCYQVNITEAVTGCKTFDLLGSVTDPAIPVAGWNWDLGNGNTASGPAITHNFGNVASQPVKLVLTDNNGCKDSLFKTIAIGPYTIATSTEAYICQGKSYEGYTTPGTYTDNFTSAGGCDSVRTLNLNVLSGFRTVVDASVCQGQAVEGYAAAGSYTDVFQSVNGCDSVRILNLTLIASRTPFLGRDTVLCAGDSIVLNPGNFAAYLWDDGSTGSSYVVKTPGTYEVLVDNDCGPSTDIITIKEGPCDIYFPSGFTPDGNGINDIFRALNAGSGVSKFYLSIYNRWGQKVFETKDYTRGWDGNNNGGNRLNGTFTWYCSYSKSSGTKTIKGTITIVR